MQQAIKEYEFYIVFMDDKANYLTAYGYDHKPSIAEFKYAVEALENDQELESLIPDFNKIIDYICFETMSFSEFVRFMSIQENFALLPVVEEE